MRSLLQSASSSNSDFHPRFIWMHLRKKFSIQPFPHITNPSQFYHNANITVAKFKQAKKNKVHKLLCLLLSDFCHVTRLHVERELYWSLLQHLKIRTSWKLYVQGAVFSYIILSCIFQNYFLTFIFTGESTTIKQH